MANAPIYHPQIEDKEIEEDLEALLMVDLELVPPSSELIKSITLRARQLGISVYDSSYLVLSETVATDLVTADKKLYDKVRATGRLLLLGDLGQKWTV